MHGNSPVVCAQRCPPVGRFEAQAMSLRNGGIGGGRMPPPHVRNRLQVNPEIIRATTPIETLTLHPKSPFLLAQRRCVRIRLSTSRWSALVWAPGAARSGVAGTEFAPNRAVWPAECQTLCATLARCTLVALLTFLPFMASIRSHTKPHPVSREALEKHFFDGNLPKALEIAKKLLAKRPKHAQSWLDLGICLVYLERWQDAMEALLKAKNLGHLDFDVFDGLAHAAFKLGQIDDSRRYGTQALQLRDASIPPLSKGMQEVPAPQALNAGTNVPRAAGAALPRRRAFNAADATRNAIAYSLYGASSHYCETAVLNAQLCTEIYPGWHCRFYVDNSVPQRIRQRLLANGAQVIDVADSGVVGTMWRMMAADDVGLDFVLFRDADSLLSAREARAVQAWLDSGRWFHVMRDNGTHTELILAGMWGLARGALPPLLPLMQRYCATGAHPVQADQLFLRAFVWPHVRQSVCQHDSFFALLDSQPFPDGPPAHAHQHVGNDDAVGQFQGQIPLPNGKHFTWALVDSRSSPPREICRYEEVSQQGQFAVHLPRAYLRAIEAGDCALVMLPDSKL